MEKLFRVIGCHMTPEDKKAVEKEEAELYFQFEDGYVRLFKENGGLQVAVWLGEACVVDNSIEELL